MDAVQAGGQSTPSVDIVQAETQSTPSVDAVQAGRQSTPSVDIVQAERQSTPSVDAVQAESLHPVWMQSKLTAYTQCGYSPNWETVYAQCGCSPSWQPTPSMDAVQADSLHSVWMQSKLTAYTQCGCSPSWDTAYTQCGCSPSWGQPTPSVDAVQAVSQPTPRADAVHAQGCLYPVWMQSRLEKSSRTIISLPVGWAWSALRTAICSPRVMWNVWSRHKTSSQDTMGILYQPQLSRPTWYLLDILRNKRYLAKKVRDKFVFQLHEEATMVQRNSPCLILPMERLLSAIWAWRKSLESIFEHEQLPVPYATRCIGSMEAELCVIEKELLNEGCHELTTGLSPPRLQVIQIRLKFSAWVSFMRQESMSDRWPLKSWNVWHLPHCRHWCRNGEDQDFNLTASVPDHPVGFVQYA